KNNPSIYEELDAKTTYLHKGLHEIFSSSNIPFTINQMGSMISVHFSSEPVVNFETAAKANNVLFKQFFHSMLSKGIYLPPSPFESWFLNNALTYTDLDATIEASKQSLQEILQ
ncbi:MAG: aspartate aminotransferase family protein, partial [Bacteroidota bacterium]|nr:aspartate aminotransferase family protein [Bacteroidota bacterium]